MLNINIKALGFVSVLALFSVNPALAGDALSWNLSRDMKVTNIKTNPSGVWAFMYNDTGVNDPANYVLLPNYAPATASFPMNEWGIAGGRDPYIGIPTKTFRDPSYRKLHYVNGVPSMHPPSNGQVIIRWKSPIAGSVSLLGRVTDIDTTCGDGILWSVVNETTVVTSGAVKGHGAVNGDGAVFSAQNVSVAQGTALYFIIDMNAGYYCDSTNLDFIITSQQ